MAPRPNLRMRTAVRRRKRRGRRRTLPTLQRFVRARWHTFRTARKAVFVSPPTVRTVVILAAILLCWLGVNWTYHAFNKPTEVLFETLRESGFTNAVIEGASEKFFILSNKKIPDQELVKFQKRFFSVPVPLKRSGKTISGTVTFD